VPCSPTGGICRDARKGRAICPSCLGRRMADTAAHLVDHVLPQAPYRHAVFLYHAIEAGLDMAIVNAGQLALYDDLPEELRHHVEDVLLNHRPDATDRLIRFAETVGRKKKEEIRDEAWRGEPVAARLAHALIHGITERIISSKSRQSSSCPMKS